MFNFSICVEFFSSQNTLNTAILQPPLLITHSLCYFTSSFIVKREARAVIWVSSFTCPIFIAHKSSSCCASFISRVLLVIVYRALIQTQFVSEIDMRVKAKEPQTQFSIYFSFIIFRIKQGVSQNMSCHPLTFKGVVYHKISL